MNRPLGEGSSGQVFEAEDRLRQGRSVAIKLIRPELVSEEVAADLASEFSALARLSHPNLASVLDFRIGSADEPSYLVMELVRGVTLAQRLAAPVPIKEEPRARWFSALCRVLAFVHSRGLVHRDLQPRNVLLGHGEVPCLVDFGLSGLVGQARYRPAGTIPYMAPETLLRSASPRSDLFSLGLLLFELTARHSFYASDKPEEILGLLADPTAFELHREATLSSETLTRSLAEVIERLLAFDPGDRYDSATEAHAAFIHATGSSITLETPATRLAYAYTPPLVDRADDVAVIEDAVQARRGSGSLLLLNGGVGVGRSRLLIEAQRTGLLAGERVLMARFREGLDGRVAHRPPHPEPHN